MDLIMFLVVELHKQRKIERMRKILKLTGVFKTRDGVKTVMEPLIRGKGGLSLTKNVIL